MGMHYVEVSAKTGQNIQELILKVITHVTNKAHNETLNED